MIQSGDLAEPRRRLESLDSGEVFNQILQDTEAELGILFSPGQIELMQVQSRPGENESLVPPEQNPEKPPLEADEPQVGKSKEEMLRELRDFVVEKNKIDVRYWDSEVCWEDSAIPLETEHDITAVRFEKKEIGEVFAM